MGSVMISVSFFTHCHTKTALKGGQLRQTHYKSRGQTLCIPVLRNPGYSLSSGTEMPWPLALCSRESNGEAWAALLS